MLVLLLCFVLKVLNRTYKPHLYSFITTQHSVFMFYNAIYTFDYCLFHLLFLIIIINKMNLYCQRELKIKVLCI